MNPRFSSSEGGKSKAERIAEAVWAELTPHFRGRCEQISALLFRRDPLKLSFGANQDEYDAVAWAILSQLITCRSPTDALTAVHQGFCRIFGADKTGPIANYKAVAREIWLLWKSPPGKLP